MVFIMVGKGLLEVQEKSFLNFLKKTLWLIAFLTWQFQKNSLCLLKIENQYLCSIDSQEGNMDIKMIKYQNLFSLNIYTQTFSSDLIKVWNKELKYL